VAGIRMAVLLFVAPCSVIEIYRHFQVRTSSFTRLHDATTQKIAVFINMLLRITLRLTAHRRHVGKAPHMLELY
jgi:hypothetical protein